MFASGLLSGGTPVLKKYQVAATVSREGIPLLISAANSAGLALASTTSAMDVAGLAIDTAIYTTVQGSGANSAERLVTVIVNPDLIFKARLSGGAADGTALPSYAVTAASANGTTITTGTQWDVPSYDEGIVWGFDGANAGQSRKITSVSSTAAFVTVPFDYATVVGDRFMRAPLCPMGSITAQLTTGLTEVNTAVAVGAGGAWLTVDLQLGDIGNDGHLQSYAMLVAGDHFLNRLS